ncbi:MULTISPECIES: MarR family winged helix-turn-helix transcriptional regulator [unclassified Amycolatopsis]|uniref:MarR family winged helix-turn-helix transcriptional regulator n=1 Tax=unclassified Amycolatopsis TaxID=2618356 RepID=UPI002E0FCAA8|nr:MULTISPECIES: MarR family winged helix-turn-helix transcriptional regulator [unclassified Amycolatopsis]WSJ75044.1 MarR family winged helix-turn-helix transcriptional regulator [Amycolatopsis sp. NBC_01307]WSK81285.1 MarR family winged helix-turn-helix transcriptional regulator [Amycolatopsis sp. NBC_01286]
MSFDDTEDDVRVELMRELKTASQLQHAWIMQAWQDAPGLHPAAAMLLSDLAKNGEARPSELAKRRFVDLSVVSRQITQLSAAGLIDRRPAPEDGRATLVSVSEKGRAELANWRTNYLEFMEQALGGWDDARVTDLTGRLAEMNTDLRRALGSVACLADTTK